MSTNPNVGGSRTEELSAFQLSDSLVLKWTHGRANRRPCWRDRSWRVFDYAMCGLFLSGLSSFAARCGGRDMATRHLIDRAVFDLRTEISKAASAIADQRGDTNQHNTARKKTSGPIQQHRKKNDMCRAPTPIYFERIKPPPPPKPPKTKPASNPKGLQ